MSERGIFCFVGYSYREDDSPLAFHGVLCKLNSSLKYFFSQKDRKSYLQCILLLLWNPLPYMCKAKNFERFNCADDIRNGSGARCCRWTRVAIWVRNIYKGQKCQTLHYCSHSGNPIFWQNETLHMQYFSIADVVIYHGSQLKFCHAPLSLSQLPSRLMSWRLFSMVLTSEHLILPILHTPW